jgi:HEAT repeats
MANQNNELIIKLVQELNAPNQMARKNAIGALRLHGKRATTAIPAIAQLLDREADPQVKAEAQRALQSLRRYVA